MKTKRITTGALCLALSLILPQMFHLIGLQQAGMVFLPMHIPVFIGGMLLGPIYGTVVGALAPLLSCALTGMPTPAIVIYKVIELASYGMMSGLLFQTYKLNEKKLGIMVVMVVSMLFGRIMNAVALVFVTNILSIPVGGIETVIAATITGIPGIVLQLIFVPAVVIAISKTKILDPKKIIHKPL